MYRTFCKSSWQMSVVRHGYQPLLLHVLYWILIYNLCILSCSDGGSSEYGKLTQKISQNIQKISQNGKLCSLLMTCIYEYIWDASGCPAENTGSVSSHSLTNQNGHFEIQDSLTPVICQIPMFIV